MTIKEFKINLLPLKNRMFRLSLGIMKNRDDAEDVVQEVMVKIWNMQKKLDDIKNTTAFAMTVTRNHCLDKLKSKKNRFLSLNEDIAARADNTPYEETETSDMVLTVKKVMQQLPEQQRTIVNLRDVEGYNYDEIMEITGWEMNYLRVNLSRGRKKIKETIIKMQQYENARY